MLLFYGPRFVFILVDYNYNNIAAIVFISTNI